MLIISEPLRGEYWGLRRAPSVTLEMHAAHRLLSAISEDGYDNAKIEIFAFTRHLHTRVLQALTTKEKIESGRKYRRIDDQDSWIETAQLWQSHQVGLAIANKDEDKSLLSRAHKLAVDVFKPDQASQELLFDGASISFNIEQ